MNTSASLSAEPDAVLVVDDDPVSLSLIEGVLSDYGYDTHVATNGNEAFDKICENDFRIVISDWQMPGMNGLDLCQQVRKRQLSAYVYFVLLTSLDGQDNLVAGLKAGADDFLTKPFNPAELSLRLSVAERIATLESRDVIIFALAKLAESRDKETGAHLERIREYTRVLTEQLGKLEKYRGVINADFIRTMMLTSPLHDIGKVGVPDHVLLKPGKLTPEEFEIMKQHAMIGKNTLDAAVAVHPTAEYLKIARDIAGSHHEKYDGSGYPLGLQGEAIPLCGRIVALADVYDALTTKRVYKDAFSHQTARAMIIEGAGKHFDPDIVEAFLRRESDFIRIKTQLET